MAKTKNGIKLIMGKDDFIRQSKYNLDLTIDKIKSLINGNNINIQINMLKEIQREYYSLLNDYLLSYYGTYQKYFDKDFKFKMLQRIKNEIEGMTYEDSYEVKTDELCDFMNKCLKLYFVLPDRTDKIDRNRKVEMWNNGKDAIIKELGVFIPLDDIEYMIQFHDFNVKYLSRYNDIVDLLNVKKVYLNYIERNQIWNFEDCTFDFNVKMIIEFSMNFESVKDRLIYLKHIDKIGTYKFLKDCLSELEFDKPTLSDEIYKLEVILRINPNASNSINKMNIQTEPKQLQAIQESLNIKWLINDTELYYLIKKLKFPEPKNSILIQFIKDNFVDKKNKPFANKNIQQGINNLLVNVKYKGKSKNSNDIDKIIKESLSNGVLSFNNLIENLLIKNYFRESDKDKLKQLTNILN